MRFLLRLVLGTVMCVSVTTLHAQDDDKPKDAEGCKDSPLITRFPGSIIHSCDNKEFEQVDFPMADSQQKHLEGKYHYWDIGTREGTQRNSGVSQLSKRFEDGGIRYRLRQFAGATGGAQRQHVDFHR